MGKRREMQLTDILCVLLLETEAAEMIPIMDKDMSVDCNEASTRQMTVSSEPLTILDKRRSIS